jgi:copper resistance protein C
VNSRLLGTLGLACLLALGLAGSVAAHAELVESDPADGETIRTSYELRATFSEPLASEGSNVIVRHETSGQEVASGGVDDEPDTMVVELPELPGGEYVARWTARGDDGHVTRGEIRFTVEAPAVTPSASPMRTVPPQTAEPTSPEPTISPTPTPSPEPGDDAPTAGMTDALLALVLAGVVIGGLSLYLLRRR